MFINPHINVHNIIRPGYTPGNKLKQYIVLSQARKLYYIQLRFKVLYNSTTLSKIPSISLSQEIKNTCRYNSPII